MNRQQKTYAEAKALAEYTNHLQIENERQFIAASGYVNDDGCVPEALWLMDNEEKFIELCDAWDKSPLNIIEDVKEAQQNLRVAEDALIDYALSIIPAEIRNTLNERRRDYSVRTKLLDAAFRLDTNTVKRKQSASG